MNEFWSIQEIKVIMTRNVTWEHLPSSCPIKTQSKHSEEGEGDYGTDDGEASLVEVDSNCEQVLLRVSTGRATAVLNNRGSSTTGKVSLEREGGKLSSATSYGEGLAGSSASTVDETSSKKAGLPAAQSRKLVEYYIYLGLNALQSTKFGLRGGMKDAD